MRKKTVVALSLCASLALWGCNTRDDEPEPDSSSSTSSSTTSTDTEENTPAEDDGTGDNIVNSTFTKSIIITYDGGSATVDGVADSVSISMTGAAVTVNSQATDMEYILRGSTTNGSFKAYSDNKFKLTLDGVSLASANSSAINIQSKKKVFVYAKEGTTSTLSDGQTYTTTAADEDEKGCVFSEGQLIFCGSGKVSISGNCKHAICSDDYVAIRDTVTVSITGSVKDGIHSNDYVSISGGKTYITSSGDCIDTGTTDDNGVPSGWFIMSGGYLEASTSGLAAKAVKAAGNAMVTGGEMVLTTSGNADVSDTSDPSYAACIKCDSSITISGGIVKATNSGSGGRCFKSGIDVVVSAGDLTLVNKGDIDTQISTDHKSPMCIKADGDVAISGGTISASTTGAAGKAIKSDGNMTISGGTLTLTTSGGTDYDSSACDYSCSACLKSEGNMVVSGGTVSATSTGVGGKAVKSDGTLTISGGTLTAIASGSSKTNYYSAKGIKSTGNMSITGGSVYAKSASHEGIESKGTLTIEDGTVEVEASDDAINASSHFYIKGGQVYAHATGNDGLDANGNLVISGGTVVAFGSTSPECGLDANEEGGYKLYITGGTVIGVGGGTSYPNSTTGAQAAVAFTSSALSNVALKDASGNLVLAWDYSNYSSTGNKAGFNGGFNGGGGMGGSGYTIVVSTPSMTTGSSYTSYSGVTISGGSEFHGLTTNATVSGGTTIGTKTASVTAR